MECPRVTLHVGSPNQEFGGVLNPRDSTKICEKISFVLKMPVLLLFYSRNRFLKLNNR
jgi:hypothetical protein